ncbi:MAG: rRNA pseudouridine synthase [Anaerolineae bacterium]|nr:rRNA pseudouridine synthase [Anaerolineae bacterium]
MVKERVQKLMAQANIGSRRACEEIISQGRVRVNGQVIKLGDQADPQADIIEVDGTKLAFPDRKIYIAFNKPRYVLSTDDPHEDDNRRTVREFIPHEGHLFNVGRLDADSEGLMVLTNDGDLANRLTHPRYRHTKTYKVVVSGLPSAETIARWEKGITLLDEETGDSFTTAPCTVKVIDGGKETTLRIMMTEGKKRQIRRVASLLGHTVRSLIRTHIGGLPLGELRSGEWRELNPKDIKQLTTPSADFRPPKRQSSRAPRRKPEGDEQPERSKLAPRSKSDLDDKSGRKSGKPTTRRKPDTNNRPARPTGKPTTRRNTRKGDR